MELQVLDQNCEPKTLVSTTTREFEIFKPDGTLITKTAAFVTDGSDGRLRYTIESGVLDVVGTWGLRAKLTIPGGVYRTARVEFAVKA